MGLYVGQGASLGQGLAFLCLALASGLSWKGQQATSSSQSCSAILQPAEG